MDAIIQQMENLNIQTLEPKQPEASVRPEVAIINTIMSLHEENKRLKMYIKFLEQTTHKSIPEWVL